ncbi:hypothetical protein [Aliarcobacter butzleri]|nr:hypothetical protein [Aliarcobacter butzleri]
MNTTTYYFGYRRYTEKDIIVENLMKTEYSRITTKSYMKYDKKQKRGF